MKVHALFLSLMLLLFSCGQEVSQTTEAAEGQSFQVEEPDLVVSMSVGTNSIKCEQKEILNRQIISSARIDKQSWENDYDESDLLQFFQRNSVHTPNTWVLFSRGFQNYFGDDIREQIRSTGIKYLFVTGEEEAHWEWYALSDADPNVMTIGSGGGSTQMGQAKVRGKYAGWSIPFGSRISVNESDWKAAKTYIDRQKVPTGKDKVLVTGGAIYHGLKMHLGDDVDNETKYSLEDLEEIMNILENPSYFNRMAEQHDPGMNRIGMLNSIKMIDYILKSGGYDSFFLAPNRDWAQPLVLSLYTASL